MKKIVFAVIILLCFAVFSCYWTPENTDSEGGIVLELGGDVLDRALAAGATTARVYLLSDSRSLLPFGDLYYVEAEQVSAGTQIEIPGVPSGTWSVLLSVGKKNSAGYYETLSYGKSAVITVSPGVQSSAPVAVKDTPFYHSALLLGSEVTGVVNTDSVYASAGNVVYSGIDSGGGTVPFAPMSLSFPAGYAINSISEGKWFTGTGTFEEELWINTNKGIVPYRGGGLVTSFHDEGVPVLVSGALSEEDDADDAEDTIVVFYQRSKGLGGVAVDRDEKDSAPWSWTDVSELEDSLAGELVLDFAVYGDYGYFATTIGAFQLNRSVVEAGGAEADWVSEGTFFEIVEGDESLPIYSIDIDDASDTFYIGTSDGVYTAGMGTDGLPSGPSLIPGTGGYGFTMVSSNDNASPYVALLSSYDLFVYRPSTGALHTFPFYSGLPGILTGFAWNDAGNVLYVSGSGVDAEGNPTPLGEGGFVSLNMAAELTADTLAP